MLVTISKYDGITVTISAVKRLIVINRIQNKGFCLHNICVCTVYIYYVYINTNTCMYIFRKKICYVYILNSFTYNIIYINIHMYM